MSYEKSSIVKIIWQMIKHQEGAIIEIFVGVGIAMLLVNYIA